MNYASRGNAVASADRHLTSCLWCGEPYTPRTVGAPRKKFCSATCKDRFHAAARKWVQRAIAQGQLSIADLKVAQASCTTQGSATEA